MSWTQFSALTNPTLPELDANFQIVGYNGTLPCTLAGTNTLTLTLSANNPTISGYQNYQRFAGIAAQTNSGATVAQVGSLPSLPVYKDTSAGPVALTGNEIVQNNYIVLVYDSALNSGAGGFHLGSAQGAGTVQSIVAGRNLTGSTITNAGTIALASSVSSIALVGSTISGSVLSGIQTFAGASIAGTASIGTVTIAGVYAGFMLTTINGAAFKLGLFNP